MEVFKGCWRLSWELVVMLLEILLLATTWYVGPCVLLHRASFWMLYTMTSTDGLVWALGTLLSILIISDMAGKIGAGCMGGGTQFVFCCW